MKQQPTNQTSNKHKPHLIPFGSKKVEDQLRDNWIGNNPVEQVRRDGAWAFLQALGWILALTTTLTSYLGSS